MLSWFVRWLSRGRHAELQSLCGWAVFDGHGPDQRVSLPSLREWGVLARRGQRLSGMRDWHVRDWNGFRECQFLLKLWGWNVRDRAGLHEPNPVHDLPDGNILHRIRDDGWIHLHQLLDVRDRPVQRVQLHCFGGYRVW